MKYRALSLQELKELEKEFIDYLVVNGITADEWEGLLKNDVPKAEKIIDLFSDVVFEGVFRKVQYLDHVSASEWLTFQALPDKLVLMALSSSDPTFDFTQTDVFQLLSESVPAGIQIYTQEKPYHKQREIELFEMTQKGAEISDGQTFKRLSLLYAASRTA